MSNEAPKKTVGQVSDSLLSRFKRINDQKAAARAWQGDLVKNEQDLWDKVEEELDLDEDKDYAIDNETGEVKEQTTFKGGG